MFFSTNYKIYIRLNLQESVVGEQIFVYNHKDICLFRHKKIFREM